jgi:hypothetical protein
VNVSEILESNPRSSQAKSHLEDKEYKEANDLLNEIQTRSEKHNKNVSEFFSSLESNILNSVFDRGVLSTFTKYNDVNEPNTYSVGNILIHYREEANGNHSELITEKEQGLVKLHRYRGQPMVISTDEKEVESVTAKLEGQKLKTEVVDKTRDFLKEGKDIISLYNNKFIPEIQKIIVEIEDEEDLKGGCGLSYCHKK